MRSFFLSLFFLFFGAGAFSSDTNDLETIKKLLSENSALENQTNSGAKVDFDDSMAFAINDILLPAYFTGRYKIITAHNDIRPFFVVIGATLRDCVLPGKHIYLQPSKPAREKLCRAYPDDVFPQTIEEFYKAINTVFGASFTKIKIPMSYANNVFNAMALSEIKSNLFLIFDALKPNGTLLITADLAPEISNLITMLTEKYPNFWPIPLIDKSQNLYHKKSKMVLVPKDRIPSIRILSDLFKLILNPPDKLVENPLINFVNQNASKWQIIDIEDFYTETLIDLLVDAGFVASYKNEIYFAECERIAKFQHPNILKDANLQDFCAYFLSDDYTPFRIFNADIHLAAFFNSVLEPQRVDFPVINKDYISKLRNSNKSLCGVQIHTIIARKPS